MSSGRRPSDPWCKDSRPCVSAQHFGAGKLVSDICTATASVLPSCCRALPNPDEYVIWYFRVKVWLLQATSDGFMPCSTTVMLVCRSTAEELVRSPSSWTASSSARCRKQRKKTKKEREEEESDMSKNIILALLSFQPAATGLWCSVA